MRNFILLIFILTCVSCYSQSKSTEQIMADSICICLNRNTQSLVTPEAKQKLLTKCLNESLSKVEVLLKQDKNVPKEKSHETGQQYGREVGRKAAAILKQNCPKFNELMGG